MKPDVLLYNSQHLINNITLYQLNHINIASFSFVFFSGLFTSFSPCLISILPICIMYISGEGQKLSQIDKLKNLFFFCLGAISSFTTLGLIATLLAKTYSQLFNGIPVISALVIIYMGFSLLNIVPLSTNNLNTRINNTNQNIKMYLSGVGIGLAISSCSTPIFVTLLIWVTSNHNLFIGLIFILIYSIGYIFPIIIGSLFSSRFLTTASSPFLNNLWAPFSGTILLSAGTFSLFSSILKY
uniref:Putative cytochrome c-type biogenesis protein DbsD-like n=1 Tax=Porphyra purpurea TaxID=2787 RepID=YCXN_PORPU|nr:hypothetical protein PopuCp179 [Porphyra purpurea]P51364.1 RecName: Full=Putative cytochrome c-type biogenesis protein DbsD-like; AltName: Full=ORF240 [Porphyra purpurea]AAC08250.1 ORF240 [Porphyra purpurea]